MAPTKMRSHPITSRGLPAGGGGTPWLTVIVTTVACMALAKAFIVLERNWRSGGDYWLSLPGHDAQTPEKERGQAFAAHAEVQNDDTALPANVVNPAGTATATATATAAASAAAAATPAATSSPSGLLSDDPALLRDIPADCGAELHLDLDGPAVSWGMSFRTETPQECCQACKQHVRTGDQGQCNSWVWCPDADCWSPDIWNHTAHECWLKVQDDPNNPRVNARGEFPADFRAIHRTAPERVQWMAGVLKPGAVGGGAGHKAASRRAMMQQ